MVFVRDGFDDVCVVLDVGLVLFVCVVSDLGLVA